MLNGTSTHAAVVNRLEALATPPKPSADSEYKHILIPTRFTLAERAAVRMGLQMAQANGAEVTVLHVVRPEPTRSLHWLDAIDHLHRSLSSSASTSRHVGETGLGPARKEVEQFLAKVVPPQLRGVKIRVECRVGDAAEELARFADEHGVDLIVLCSDGSPWSLPLWPGLSQRLLRLTHKQIVFVRPDASPFVPFPAANATPTPAR